MAFNEQLFFFFNGFAGRSIFLDSVIVFFANTLPFILIGFTLVYFVFIRRSAKRLGLITFATLIAAFITEILKWSVFRHPRPFAGLENVVQLIQITAFDSFPSQHATIFAALATGMFIYDRKAGVLYIVFAVLIGIARIMAGVHYPLDILTGFLIGFLVTYGCYRLLRKLLSAVRNYIS